jgi:hypothetical protein
MHDEERTPADARDPVEVPRGPWCVRAPVAFAAVVAALGAAYATLVYWPGVFYGDSYSRWSLAEELLLGGERLAHVSIGPSLFMAATYALTESYAAFTLVQAFLFFFSTLLLVSHLGVRGPWLAVPAAALLGFPLFRGYAVYVESGIGAATGMSFLLVATLWRPARAGRVAEALRAGALFGAAFVLFSFRQNAVTVVPVLAALVWRVSRSRWVRLAHLGAVAAALGAALLLPAALGTRGSASAPGLAWEIVGTLQRVKDPAYDHYLDDVGNTRAALAANVDEGLWQGLVSPQALPWNRLYYLDREGSARLARAYVRLAFAEPRAFLANKWHLTRRTLGLGTPLRFGEFDQNLDGLMPLFGLHDTALRRREFERVEGAMASGLLRTPWLVLLIGLALVAFARRGLVPPTPASGAILALAASFYAAFLVTTHGFEFRYFFPALHLVAVLALVVAAGLLREVAGRAYAAAVRGRRAVPTPGAGG